MNARSSSDSGVPSLRSRLRQATAEAILGAAEEVFAEQGLHGARMGDIAQRAGVAVGTLYNHFKDRDALLAGLIDLRAGAILSRIDQAIAEEARQSFRHRLTGLLRSLFDYFVAHRHFFYISLQGELGHEAGAFPTAGPKGPALRLEIYQRFEKLVRSGVRQKALKAEGADLYAAMLLGIVRGIFMRHKLVGEQHQPVDVDVLVRMFLDGAGV